uniref:Uncharacterized protein n=1 Tax=Avena sativa TaxID=4498 RepID=A0ACD5U5Q9_AVESA
MQCGARSTDARCGLTPRLLTWRRLKECACVVERSIRISWLWLDRACSFPFKCPLCNQFVKRKERTEERQTCVARKALVFILVSTVCLLPPLAKRYHLVSEPLRSWSPVVMAQDGDDAAKAAELAKKMAEVDPFTPPRAQLTDGEGSSGGERRVVERVVRHSFVVAPPLVLTHTNYSDWALVMQVQLQSNGWWMAIVPGVYDYHTDREALGVILRAVPPEMLRTLAVKKTAKDAWDTLKTLRLRCERVREARAQTHRTEFENIQFKDGEKVEQFAMRLTGIMHDLEVLGDGVSEHKAVLKFLRVVPKRFKQLAHSITQLLDLKTMTVEKLTGRFMAVEEELDMEDDEGEHHGGTRLLLTEQEWRARDRSGAGKKRGNFDIRKVRCYNCQVYGHYSRDCTEPRREQAHLAAATADDEPVLL